jgi:parallel beta-helix repeat protein
MKKIAFILFLLIPLLAGATDYYVKTAGNDSNTGLSDAQAWKTIIKVNSEWSSGKFIPGDRIYFNRGDIFTGTITVASSGSPLSSITIGAYGTGIPPRISGFTIVPAWTDEGDGIYSATIHPQSFPNMLTIDGIHYAKGRWPNDTWMTIDSRTSTSITDAALPSSPDWDGGEIVIRKNAWIIDRTEILNHSGTHLGFNDTGYDPVAGWGYFIQNHQSALDKYGEWCYDEDDTKLYVYFGSVNPATVTTRVSTRDTGITLQSRNYITITGLTIEGANSSGIYISASDYITIQECKIQFCGDAAIDGAHNGGNNSLGFRAINDTIYHVQNQGIVLFGEFDGALIQGCKLDSIGMFPGMNFNGDGQNNAIKLHGSNHVVEYNWIKDVGYNGIDFGGNQVKVRYNFIDGFGSVKDDVGGIYTTCFTTLWVGREIENNIVLNGWGAPAGRAEDTYSTTGIYADQREANLTISGNTVYNVGQGIFLHNAHECQVFGNTVYDAKAGALWIQHDNAYPDDPTRNLEIRNNKLLTVGPWAADANAHGYVMYSRLGLNDNYLFGSSSDNIICRFFGESTAPYYLIKLMGADWSGRFYSLTQWKLNSGQDQNSTGNLGPRVTSTSELHFIYNSLRINNTFTLSATLQDVAGLNYSGTISLPPFTSLVLLGSGTITDNVDPGQLPSSYPVVQSFLSGITEISAYVGATITNDGGSAVTARGICWSTTINPDITDPHSSNGTGTGTFYHTISGLTKGTTYYVRAYATNSTGTGYSANMTFTTTGISDAQFVKHEEEFVSHEGKFVKVQESEE